MIKNLLQILIHRVDWEKGSFLVITLLVSIVGVPLYLWYFGLDWFQVTLFFAFFIATGMSIVFGYHRLFSHRTFLARMPIRLICLIFAAAAFEDSALHWSSEHRRHHKHVDSDGDPHDINKGFFHAHMGWLLFKPDRKPPMNNVSDLEKDPLVVWQYKHCVPIGVLTGFLLPTALGFFYNGVPGALGGFLIPGVLRVVCLHHCTYFINSFCHTIGSRPYTSKCSARDSLLLALFTFGEGYHNFHHAFPQDYRNGVRLWDFDPAKWAIWTLSKLGLTSNLHRVDEEKIRHALERERGLREKSQVGQARAGMSSGLNMR